VNHAELSEFLGKFRRILGEGAVIERLRRRSDLALDPHVLNAGFIYEEKGRAALEAIYREYLDIGSASGLPLLLSTPTWRAARERIAAAGLAGKDVNGDNFRFIDALREKLRRVRKESPRLRPHRLPRGCVRSGCGALG
jgi:homocysteine S-methyltransferase